ncbi:MAG: hypothetical protein RLZZ444_4246, partial [Pseudomonadota bacterium]
VAKHQSPSPVYLIRPIIYDEDGEPAEPPEGEELPDGWHKSMMIVEHRVFNRDQCIGLPPPRYVAPPLADLPPLERAESLIRDNRNLPPIHETRRDSACFMPKSDEIKMPLRGQFKSADEFYSTLFHESTHNAESPIMPEEKWIVPQVSSFRHEDFGIIKEIRGTRAVCHQGDIDPDWTQGL